MRDWLLSVLREPEDSIHTELVFSPWLQPRILPPKSLADAVPDRYHSCRLYVFDPERQFAHLDVKVVCPHCKRSDRVKRETQNGYKRANPFRHVVDLHHHYKLVAPSYNCKDCDRSFTVSSDAARALLPSLVQAAFPEYCASCQVCLQQDRLEASQGNEMHLLPTV